MTGGRRRVITPPRGGRRRRRRVSRQRLYAVVGGSALVLTLGVGAVLVGRQLLGPPPNITALSSTEPGSVHVEWAHVDGAERYRVIASTDPTMSDATTRTFTRQKGTLTGLRGGQRYFITVEPVGVDDHIKLGPRAVKVRRAAPTNVSVSVASTSAVGVKWKASEEAPRFVVRWSANESMRNPQRLYTDEENALITGLKAGAKYWIDVAPADDTAAVSEPVETTIPDMTALSVGSFNLYGVDNDSRLPSGAEKWRNRRPVVVDQIMSADLDVVGLQELNGASSYRGRVDHGSTQMADLEYALQAKNTAWRLVNDVPFNCARAWTASRCSYRYRGASNGTRIAYRSDRLELVASGSVRYARQNTSYHRYLAWAVFRIRETGAEVFFTSTHLQPGRSSSDVNTRRSQWKQLIAEVRERSNGLPIISVGDFNTSRNQKPAEMFEQMRAAGIPEIMGTRPGVNPPTQNRAEQTIRGGLSSYNGFKRSLIGAGSCYCGSKTKTGNSIDFIFASERLEVARWEIVARLDAKFRLLGVIPSDHHLVTAVLRIPTK